MDILNLRDGSWREFHVARRARDRYQFSETLFATNGNVILANFQAARVFAKQMNDKRDLVRFPEQAVKAGQINCLGLIDEILHFLIAQYRERNGEVLRNALATLDEKLGADAVDATLKRFCDLFPPVAVYKNEQDIETYLQGGEGGTGNREIALEEMLLLWVENMNPACAPFLELFDDDNLEKDTPYKGVIQELQAFFATQPAFGPDNINLIEMLRAPALAHPHSLSAQLEFILTRWGGLAGKFIYRLLGSLDYIKEEEKPVFFGPGPAQVPSYLEMAAGAEEADRFSPDKEWMPQVILIAKNSYVWLDQLSRKYERAITKLNDIPDEELDALAARGITGLWLIGLWERSAASQRIKQMCGNPDAVASAYSLMEYEIAGDLGAHEGMDDLRRRAWERGIRLASDMVPNHMAIDSKWVVQNPDWFISLDESPFPSYTFNGPDLSNDERVGIHIEDHYYSRSDAAVVFKRVDRHTGSEKYVYHGNDGTSMPWNDTAQLNYLNAQVREGVIQTILHVARNFPIIRFDAAMTLAKKHYQRLWFPMPGTGGAIPSRSEHGMSTGQFNEAFPEEFWREVVDRVAQEVPETLLLAEAFWMMEGFFVRTLGMHRVYNSAFMNMLRDEENAKYRLTMKNTLEFDPDILKRFVNFMNNPDERTAIEQFGDGDKYFGICTLMSTLPGLPMFGHGQIEGFSEKYGMEYRRALWEEKPNEYLVARHEREIFPLLHLRPVFAEVHNFLLYDFWADGHVNEDVFAYSNRAGDQRGLVVYHNRFAETRGWIRSSVGFAVKNADGGKDMVQRTLSDGLGLHYDIHKYIIFRDNVTNLEYIRRSSELCEKGLYVELAAYKCHVFLDFREVIDNEWRQYAHLTDYLAGRGVPSIQGAILEILLQPVHRPFLELVEADFFMRVIEARTETSTPTLLIGLLDAVEEGATALLQAIADFRGSEADVAALAKGIRKRFNAALHVPEHLPVELRTRYALAMDANPDRFYTLLCLITVGELGKLGDTPTYRETSRSWLDEWQLGRLISSMLRESGLDQQAADYAVATIKVLTTHGDWFATTQEAGLQPWLAALVADPDAQRLLQINRFQNILWYNKEAFEQLLWWLVAATAVEAIVTSSADADAIIAEAATTVQSLRVASESAGYQVEKLVDAVA